MLRLTGGLLKGRGIAAPPHLRTRPTQAKLRQALFNSLQMYIQDARVLDLFAGSGALGFEALSRGASHVLFVEKDRATAQLIRKNAAELGVAKQVEVLADDVENILPRLQSKAPFDLVFADPPYGYQWEKTLLESWPWDKLVGEGGRVCLEWGLTQGALGDGLASQVHGLEKVREKKYGDSVLTTYERVLG